LVGHHSTGKQPHNTTGFAINSTDFHKEETSSWARNEAKCSTETAVQNWNKYLHSLCHIQLFLEMLFKGP